MSLMYIGRFILALSGKMLLTRLTQLTLFCFLLQQGSEAVADPDWLEQRLNCREFLSEVKTRYAGVTTMATLSPEQRRELEMVLDIACSERFRECNFANCKPRPTKEATSEESSKYDPTVWEARLRSERFEQEKKVYDEQMKAYDKLYEEQALTQKRDIIEKLSTEKKRGLRWERLTMPDLPTRKPKPKPKPKPKADPMTPPLFSPDGGGPSGSILTLPPGPEPMDGTEPSLPIEDTETTEGE